MFKPNELDGSAEVRHRCFSLTSPKEFEGAQILRDFGVAISYGCHVSCRILGVLLGDRGRKVDDGDTWWHLSRLPNLQRAPAEERRLDLQK